MSIRLPSSRSGSRICYRLKSVVGTDGVHVDGVGAASGVLALSGAQHDDLVAVGDLAGVLEDLVGEGHEILAGLVVVVLIEQEGLGAPGEGQPV